MLTFQEIQSLLNSCRYKDWSFMLKKDSDPYGQPYLQVGFYAQDNGSLANKSYDPKGLGLVWQTGRKWRISYHMTRTEVVQTLWLAVLKAEEHEARENFLYNGKAVFNTHIDIEELWKKADLTDVRSPMTISSPGSVAPSVLVVPARNLSEPSVEDATSSYRTPKD